MVDVYDPLVNAVEAKKNLKINVLANEPENKKYSAVIIGVPHKQFIDMGINKICDYGVDQAVIYDVKSGFPKNNCDGRL